MLNSTDQTHIHFLSSNDQSPYWIQDTLQDKTRRHIPMHACIHPSITPALSITIHFAATCIFPLWIIDLILFGWTTMNASSRYSKAKTLIVVTRICRLTSVFFERASEQNLVGVFLFRCCCCSCCWI